jgi:hypothetical protein
VRHRIRVAITEGDRKSRLSPVSALIRVRPILGDEGPSVLTERKIAVLTAAPEHDSVARLDRHESSRASIESRPRCSRRAGPRRCPRLHVFSARTDDQTRLISVALPSRLGSAEVPSNGVRERSCRTAPRRLVGRHVLDPDGLSHYRLSSGVALSSPVWFCPGPAGRADHDRSRSSLCGDGAAPRCNAESSLRGACLPERSGPIGREVAGRRRR